MDDIVHDVRLEGVSRKTARDDVQLVAEALGWRVEARRRSDGSSEPWLISPALQADEAPEDDEEPMSNDTPPKDDRSVTRTIRRFLKGALLEKGRGFRVAHARLGHHVRAVTGAGDPEFERFLHRGQRRGEWIGTHLEGWTYNPSYAPPPRRERP